MKILIACEVFYPSMSGVAVTAERLAAQMAARGHEVSVVTPSRNRSYYTERRKGYTVYRVPSWPNPFRKGFRVTLFPHACVRRVFQTVQPEVLHIHDPAMISTAAVREARRTAVPVVVTNHLTFEYILTYLPWLKPIHPLLRRFLAHDLTSFYNRCDLLTVPTETIKTYLQEAGHIHIPIQVISNGVDIARFGLYYRPAQLVQRYRLHTDRPVVTYVGRMDKEKNVGVLIEAFAKVAADRPVQFVMLGSGDLLEELQEQARQLKISQHIRWIPRIENSSPMLNQLYDLTDVFCIASPRETESMVTMEAMASGLPVVAADGGALPELVANGINGYLVPEDQPERWAEAITTLLEDDDLRRRMARASIEKVAERNLTHTVDAFEAVYTEVLQPAKG